CSRPTSGASREYRSPSRSEDGDDTSGALLTSFESWRSLPEEGADSAGALDSPGSLRSAPPEDGSDGGSGRASAGRAVRHRLAARTIQVPLIATSRANPVCASAWPRSTSLGQYFFHPARRAQGRGTAS